MIEPSPTAAVPDRCRSKLQKWTIVLGVLIVSHLVAAKVGYDRLNGNVFPDLTINSSLDDWAQATRGMDVSSYLEAAQNFAAGKGLVTLGALGVPNKLGPFSYWSPGTPFILGTWLKWTGGTTVWSCFLFSALMQFVAGVIAVATAALFTRRIWALALTAFLSACFPPLHIYFYSSSLTSSEIAALVPLGMMFFALCVAGLKVANPNCRAAIIIMWFAAAGVWLGLASLVRDSLGAFAAFLAVAFIVTARPRSLRQYSIAIASGLLLMAATEAVRYPVKKWNLKRVGVQAVSTSSATAVWRAGLWLKHDACEWYDVSGIGLGQYLDPDAAERVEQYYLEQKPNPALNSFDELVQAILRHPLKAFWFRASRLHVLWLGNPWQALDYLPVCIAFSAAMYVVFFAYIFARLKARRPIPAVLCFYPIFLLMASVLIHYEFRYTFPMWQMFFLLPAFWAAHLAERKAAPATANVEPVSRTAAERIADPIESHELLGLTSV